MSRKRYKDYLRQEDAVIPRTSCWRDDVNKAMQCTDNDGDNESQDGSSMRTDSSVKGDFEDIESSIDTNMSCIFDCINDTCNEECNINQTFDQNQCNTHLPSNNSENSFSMESYCSSIESEDHCHTEGEISNDSSDGDADGESKDFGFINSGNFE